MKPRPWLIAYDVADPRRLARVHHVLKQQTVPLQYSVFVATLSEPALADILTGLAQCIDHRADDVRAYPLPPEGAIHTLGRPWLVEGLLLGGG